MVFVSLVSAIIGGIASYASASTAANATTYAADQQTAMQNKMLALQKPFVTAGQGALDKLSSYSGDYRDSPLYKYQVQEGTSAARKAYAARGMANSPAAAEAETKVTESIGATESDKVYTRAQNLATMGASTSVSAGSQQLNSQSTTGQMISTAGTQSASGIAGVGGSLMGGMQAYNQQSNYEKWLNQGKTSSSVGTPTATSSSGSTASFPTNYASTLYTYGY